jgi:hypothetical protein
MPSETLIINYLLSWLHIPEDGIIQIGTLCTYPYVTKHKTVSVICTHLIAHYRLFQLLSERKVNGTDRGKTLTYFNTQTISHILNLFRFLPSIRITETVFWNYLFRAFRLKYSFIHSVFCLTTGPKPPLKRFLHIVRSRASSYKTKQKNTHVTRPNRYTCQICTYLYL